MTVDGIEYVLPIIFKAYKREWAEQFVSQGIIYFTNLEVFRESKNYQRGDKTEREGTIISANGIKFTTNNLVPTYLWCATMETNPKTILETWDRDTIVEVRNTVALAKRIQKATASLGHFGLHIGPVTYDKDWGRYSLRQRMSQPYECIFQKPLRYSGQKEYRFSFSSPTRDAEHHIVTIGDCSDIARIIE